MMARAHKTFHINVPEEDLELMEWLSVQYNQSSSVRELIRAAYREYGPVDLFTGETAERTPGVRGRAKQSRGAESTVQSQRMAKDAAKSAMKRKDLLSTEIDAGEYADEEKSKAITDREDEKVSTDSIEETVSSRSRVPAEREKGKARAPSRDKPPERKRGGIRMDASVLLGASGKQAKNESAKKTESKQDNRTDDKKKDAIRDLMNLMDL